MENASKALIIAGSMLIALMIIGALLLMFNSLSSYQDTGTKNTREAQIISFNNQYESFNRKNVRGNDLYSLLNRVVYYNRRKSSAGTGVADEGQYVAFEPMTITYTFNNQQKKLTFDDKNRIFVGEFINFSLNDKTSNKLKEHFKNKLKETYATNENMLSLAAGITNLYLGENNISDKEILSAFTLWNKYAKNKYTGENSNEKKIEYYRLNILSNENIKEDIYTYYEYMQFKRAQFDCVGTEYNNKTGRIIKMDFKFNDKFN